MSIKNDFLNDFLNDEKGYKIIGEVFAKKLNRYWYWKKLKVDNPDYAFYSMRHSFKWSGDMDINSATLYRFFAPGLVFTIYKLV